MGTADIILIGEIVGGAGAALAICSFLLVRLIAPKRKDPFKGNWR
jgi:hypothetical protein